MVYQTVPSTTTLFDPPQRPATRVLPLSNAEVADQLERIAELLEAQAANPYRVAAYRRGAATVRELPLPLAQIVGDGSPAALRELPGIGESLSQTLVELTQSGTCELLRTLEADSMPAAVLSTVPGIGPELAERVYTKLGIGSLPELAAAAGDGRLSQVPGFGPKRLRAVRETLAGRLQLSLKDKRSLAHPRSAKPTERRSRRPLPGEPSVEELLSIDAQYRRQAALGLLPRIAPKRFNPTGAAWLPVLNTQRDGRQYTVFYSNSAKSHELGTTRDWVVIYRHDRRGRGQWTVLTSQFGPHKGRRVVRGREDETPAEHDERE